MTNMFGDIVKDYLDYGFSHDEIHASSQLLREYKWKGPLRYRQPTVFGPAPGPRQQNHYGHSYTSSLQISTSIKREVYFKTSATLLRNLFPNTHYSFTKSDTIATASFTVQSLSNMAWLGGRGYDLVEFCIHGVSVEDSNGKLRKGVYCPLMLENMADPIITGREELGAPKLYSEIEIEENGRDCSVKIGWHGSIYAEFSWKNLTKNELEKTVAKEDEESEGLFFHKYMPSPEIGKAICESDFLLDISCKTSLIRSQSVSAPLDTRFNIKDLGVEQLPTLHHIVARLAELPVFEILMGSVTEHQGVTDLSKFELLN
jgi:acetoacetate decarboxylase